MKRYTLTRRALDNLNIYTQMGIGLVIRRATGGQFTVIPDVAFDGQLPIERANLEALLRDRPLGTLLALALTLLVWRISREYFVDGRPTPSAYVVHTSMRLPWRDWDDPGEWTAIRSAS